MMKKRVSLLCFMAIMLSMSITVFAGSIPEDLLNSDDAQVFFAEVVYYHPDKENPDIELSPVKVVKGDVKTGVKLTYYNPNTVGDFKVKEGNVYLFTYFDENNPTDIFEVTSYDTSTLKLKNVEGDMWERFNDYLNEGIYERAEKERSGIGKQISFAEFLHTDPLSEAKVEKVMLRYQDELHEADVDEFEKIAQEIMITNVKNDMLHDEKAKPKQPEPYKTNLYIELLDENEQLVAFAAVSRHGEVDRYALMMSRLMSKDYEMEKEDLEKLYSLFPEDVQKNIVASQEHSVKMPELPDENAKNYKPWLYGGVIAAFLIAFIIGFAIKKKN